MFDQGSFLVERRRHPRKEMRARANCICLDPDAVDVVSTLQTLDISRSGLGAYAERAFYPGQRVVVCLPRSPETGRRSLCATVVRCDSRDEAYHVGLEFDSAAAAGSRGRFSVAIAA